MQQNLWSPECPWILSSGQVSKNCLGLVGTSPPIRRWIRTSVASRRLFKRCSSDLMKSSNFRCLETTRVDLMCWREVGFEVSEDQPSSTSGYIRYPVDINDINESYRSYVLFWLHNFVRPIDPSGFLHHFHSFSQKNPAKNDTNFSSRQATFAGTPPSCCSSAKMMKQQRETDTKVFCLLFLLVGCED